MSAEVENAIDIALKVSGALQAVGAEYFVGGSLASSLQGEPRATNDIDFVISLPAEPHRAARTRQDRAQSGAVGALVTGIYALGWPSRT